MASFGKSQDGTYYEWVGDQGSIYTLGNKYVTLSNSSFSSSMRSVIPAYTQLSRVDVCLRWKTSIGSTKGDGYLYIGDTKVGGEWNTGKNWRDDWVTGLQSYFQSGTANTGLPTSEIRGRFEASWGRTSYYVFKIRWYPKYTITVNNGTGGGTYNMGSTITISAEEPTGYDFVQWNDGVKSISRTVTVTSNATYTPEFKKKTFTVKFKNYDNSILETKTVNYGDIPTYTGSTPIRSNTAEFEYNFNGWSPSLGAVYNNIEYVAQFIEIKRKYTITTIITPLNSGTVRVFLEDGTEVTGQTEFEYKTSLYFEPVPNEGYLIDGGYLSQTLLEQNETLYYDFRKIKYKINIVIDPLDSGEFIGETEYEYGDTVYLEAIPYAGYQFKQWSSGSDLFNPILTYKVSGITKDTTTTITISFKNKTYFFSKNWEPLNAGEVTINGQNYIEPVNYGETVVFKAIPKEGYKFIRWNENLYSNPLTVVANDDAILHYTAYFEPLVPKFKSVKIYYPTGANVVSPTNPLVAGQPAQIVVKIAME